MRTGVVEKYSMIKTEWECIEMYTYNVLCTSLLPGVRNVS